MLEKIVQIEKVGPFYNYRGIPETVLPEQFLEQMKIRDTERFVGVDS